ncbi:MAG: hypothetical protein ACM3OB_06990, partial [Acidobacteriota bacterium]
PNDDAMNLMRLNPLLVIASVVYGAAGLGLTFAPAELLAALHAPAPGVSVWAMQLLGAALLGLAIQNYVQRYAVIGGVLGRPILLANLSFLSVSFFASVTSWRHDGGVPYLLASVILGFLFAAFGVRLFAGRGAGADRPSAVERFAAQPMADHSLHLAAAPLAAGVLAATSGNGAAAFSVLAHRVAGGESVGLVGLFIFLGCMAAVVVAWLRLRRNRPEQ